MHQNRDDNNFICRKYKNTGVLYISCTCCRFIQQCSYISVVWCGVVWDGLTGKGT